MKRIVIVGTTGSGKTTLARTLAQQLKSPHVEVDSIHWLPDWKERPHEETRALLAQHLAQPRWVVDGNYSFVRDLIWGQADTLIWLDYSLFISQWRLLWRSLRRIRTQEMLWGVNQETFRAQFLSRDSLFWWAITSRRSITGHTRSSFSSQSINISP